MSTTRAVTALAALIHDSRMRRQTDYGVALDVDRAGMLMSPETAAEMDSLRKQVVSRDEHTAHLAECLVARTGELATAQAQVAEQQRRIDQLVQQRDDLLVEDTIRERDEDEFAEPRHPSPCRWPASPDCLCGPSDAPRAPAPVVPVGEMQRMSGAPVPDPSGGPVAVEYGIAMDNEYGQRVVDPSTNRAESLDRLARAQVMWPNTRLVQRTGPDGAWTGAS